MQLSLSRMSQFSRDDVRPPISSHSGAVTQHKIISPQCDRCSACQDGRSWNSSSCQRTLKIGKMEMFMSDSLMCGAFCTQLSSRTILSSTSSISAKDEIQNGNWIHSSPTREIIVVHSHQHNTRVMYFSTDFEYSFISSPYTFSYFLRPIWVTHTKLRRRVDDEVNIYLRDNDNTAELLGKLRKRNISSTPSKKKTTTSSRTEAIHTFFCCVFSSFPNNPMMMQAEKWLQNSMPAIHSELSLEKDINCVRVRGSGMHTQKKEETPSICTLYTIFWMRSSSTLTFAICVKSINVHGSDAAAQDETGHSHICENSIPRLQCAQCATFILKGWKMLAYNQKNWRKFLFSWKVSCISSSHIDKGYMVRWRKKGKFHHVHNKAVWSFGTWFTFSSNADLRYLRVEWSAKHTKKSFAAFDT